MVSKKKSEEEFVWVNGIKCTTAAPLVDIDRIIPYEKNAKMHGSELEFLKNLIRNEKVGFRDPIEVDRNMVIVSGHGRRLAAIELGMEKVPCLIHKDMEGDASDVYRLMANRTSELSGYDYDLLNAEVAKLKDMGWDMPSLSFEDMASFDDTVTDEEIDAGDYIEVGEGPEEPPEIDYKILVHCPTKEEATELFESLTESGVNCQMLD